MCIGQIYSYATTVPQFLPDIESFQNGANDFRQQAYCGIKEIFARATDVANSPGVLKEVLRGVNSVLDITSTMALQPILPQVSKNFTVVQDFVLATGVINSARYFLNDFYRDVIDQKGFKVLSEVCFAVGKIGVTATWLAKNTPLELGIITNTVGSLPYFGVLANLSTFPLLDYSFIAGSAVIVAEQVYKMSTGDFTAYGALTLTHNVSEIALISLGLIGGYSTVLIAGLALVCATTAVSMFMLERYRAQGVA